MKQILAIIAIIANLKNESNIQTAKQHIHKNFFYKKMHMKNIERMTKKKTIELIFSIDLLIAISSIVLLILIDASLNFFFRH